VLARTDHGRLPLRLRPLEPRAILEAAAARARAAARTRRRRIVVGDTAPGSWLLADPDRAAQALDNLVSNALQYGRGTITLTACEDGKLLRLHVADQGSGFPADMAVRAFQRFTRGKGVPGQGSGLGLSLVAAIARAHRGAATICNQAQGGADACIALPRYLPEPPSVWQARLPGDAGTVNRQPEDASPAKAGVASQPAIRQRTAASHIVPCRRKGNRCRPSGNVNRLVQRVAPLLPRLRAGQQPAIAAAKHAVAPRPSAYRGPASDNAPMMGDPMGVLPTRAIDHRAVTRPR
jgi:Histidine kinase-, DNA gyrase B-, and HSP90-like ATPase